MRTTVILVLIFLLGVYKNVNAQKDIFIKKIEFKLDFISDVDYENEYFLTMKLNKGITYKFVIDNNINEYDGMAVVKLLDGDKLLVTNQIQDKYFEQFGFKCNKTGFYDILIQYKDNKRGYSFVDIYMIQ